MADAEDPLDKIQESVDLQKQCARKFNSLTDELEETMKTVNVTEDVGSSMSLGAGDGILESGFSLFTTVGSESTFASKSKEAEQIPLKPGAEEGQPSGSDDEDEDDDDDDDNAKVIERLLRSEAKQKGLDLPYSVRLRIICRLPEANIFMKIMPNEALLVEREMLLQQILQRLGQKRRKMVGKSVEKRKTSKTLRENAKTPWNTAEEMQKALHKIRKAVEDLFRTEDIIRKKNRSSDEKTELIQYAIRKTQNEVVRRWLRKYQESEVFFTLIDLCSFIQDQLEEEEEKKKKKKKKKKTIDLIFLAHGGITDEMIPARWLWPLSSITDVILYPPWNCRLAADAAYAIATGRIEPHHRIFFCADTENRPLTNYFYYHQKPSTQLDNWNSMKDSKKGNVPIILVSPVGKPDDYAFPAFLSLEKMFGEPGAGRYVIPYLATDIGRVPFVVVTLALSLVLDFSKYKAMVHLAACLGKIPTDTTLKEYLNQQYCYTESHPVMSVTPDAIPERNDQLFNMMKAVFE